MLERLNPAPHLHTVVPLKRPPGYRATGDVNGRIVNCGNFQIICLLETGMKFAYFQRLVASCSQE